MTYEEYFADKYPDVDVEDKVNSVDDEQKKSAAKKLPRTTAR